MPCRAQGRAPGRAQPAVARQPQSRVVARVSRVGSRVGSRVTCKSRSWFVVPTVRQNPSGLLHTLQDCVAVQEHPLQAISSSAVRHGTWSCVEGCGEGEGTCSKVKLKPQSGSPRLVVMWAFAAVTSTKAASGLRLELAVCAHLVSPNSRKGAQQATGLHPQSFSVERFPGKLRWHVCMHRTPERIPYDYPALSRLAAQCCHTRREITNTGATRAPVD